MLDLSIARSQVVEAETVVLSGFASFARKAKDAKPHKLAPGMTCVNGYLFAARTASAHSSLVLRTHWAEDSSL
jgi:hypothetical protein